MAREIRVTIDDDEVFERLRRRKEAMDVSWEEALRRGLERGGAASAGAGISVDTGGPAGSPGMDVRVEPFDANFGEEIRREVEESVRETLSGVGLGPDAPRSPGGGAGPAPAPGEDLDAELDRLKGAEDAVLAFDFLPGEPAHEVPLRVTLETGADGLDVDVVAVRAGKDTSGMNRFADADRRTVSERLAAGDTATLRLQDGAERYDVVPAISWGRTGDGTPTVTDVEIASVRFED